MVKHLSGTINAIHSEVSVTNVNGEGIPTLEIKDDDGIINVVFTPNQLEKLAIQVVGCASADYNGTNYTKMKQIAQNIIDIVDRWELGDKLVDVAENIK